MEFKTVSKLVDIKKDKYLNRYVSSNSSEEMSRYKLFPNAKEVTESYAMLNAIEKYVMEYDPAIKKGNDNVGVYVVGDGHTPRTGMLFALMTKWTVTSIDPQMRKKDYSGIKRLFTFTSKVEDIGRNLVNDFDYTIMVLPHSHAKIEDCWDLIDAKRKWLVTMPCCVNKDLRMPKFSYVDEEVWSPKNRIDIYCNYMNVNFTKQ